MKDWTQPSGRSFFFQRPKASARILHLLHTSRVSAADGSTVMMTCNEALSPSLVAAFILAALASPVHATTTVVTGSGLPSDGLFSSLSRENNRVVQQFFDSSFFTPVSTPLLVTAMSFRLPAVAGVNYPSLGDLFFSRYEITLAMPSAAAAEASGLTSAVFSQNMSDPVLVRSGSLTIPAGSFISNAAGADAEFSFVIPFDTPYAFTPGQDLVMLIRHTGHGDVNGVETRWNFDGYTWQNGTVINTSDVDAAIANFGPGTFNLANKIEFTLVPVPAAVWMFASAIAGLIGIRRYRVFGIRNWAKITRNRTPGT
ncbi:MAG: VPLPA-CTERM sorting domain-containing protein [Chromatiales bacterium]|nr:VPLPA-CTERM sorting domain-containing protein [Chromatiales bacterium]